MSEPTCPTPMHHPLTECSICHPSSVDWPARFRAAAEVAEGAGWDAAAHVFGALGVKAKHSPDEVGAIVRALLGETS